MSMHIYGILFNVKCGYSKQYKQGVGTWFFWLLFEDCPPSHVTFQGSFESAKWEWEHLKWYFNQITVETLFRFCLNKWWIQRHIWYKWEYLKMDLVLDIKELILILLGVIIRSDQSLSRVQLFATPWITAHQASLSITNSQSSRRLTAIVSVMPSSPLILCHPLLLLPPIPPSIRVFSNESTLLMRWPKYWSFSFSSIPSKEIPGLISFRMDWLDLLAVSKKKVLRGWIRFIKGFSGGSDCEESTCNAGDQGSTPGLGRSHGEGNGYTLQYPCLRNPMDRGAWQVTVHGVPKSWTGLSN